MSAPQTTKAQVSAPMSVSHTDHGSVNPVPSGAYSACIAWAEPWVTEEMVRKELDECDWGTIVKVDFVGSSHKRQHNKVFIHYSDINDEVKAHLDDGNLIKVYYKDTYFWKVSKSRYEYKDNTRHTQTSGGGRFELVK